MSLLLVQRFLFDPDGSAGDGLAVSQVATQDVLAELRRVDSPAAGRLDAETFLKQTLEDLQPHKHRQLFKVFSGNLQQQVFKGNFTVMQKI